MRDWYDGGAVGRSDQSWQRDVDQGMTGHSTISHEDILARLEQGDHQFHDINAKLVAIIAQLEPLGSLQSDMTKVKEDIAATKELVEAWAAVKTLSRFLKWAAGIIAALAAITVASKAGIASIIRSLG